MKKLILLLVFFVALAFSKYPLYKQCDKKWGSHIVSKGPKTMCQIGCLVTSVSMALVGTGRKYDPGALNKWLKNNNGYSGNLFIWASVNKLGMKFEKKVGRNAVKAELKKGRVVIINVRNGGHWVLATGHSGDNINVNDPGYSKSSYKLSEISDVGVFIK